MNDSDTEFIAEEETTQAASTQDTSLTTTEANLHVEPNDNQSKKKKRTTTTTTTKKNYLSGPKKLKVTKQEGCHLVPEMEGKENRTFVICLACNIPLCLVKERNCFQKHHI